MRKELQKSCEKEKKASGKMNTKKKRIFQFPLKNVYKNLRMCHTIKERFWEEKEKQCKSKEEVERMNYRSTLTGSKISGGFLQCI